MIALSDKDSYLAAFESAGDKPAAKSPNWLGELRRRARDDFEKLGFPSTKLEDWRYVNIKPLTDAEFHWEPGSAGDAQIPPLEIIDNDAPVLEFHNGLFHAGSNNADVPEGVRVTTIAKLPVDDSELLQNVLGAEIDTSARHLAAVNAALFSDGAVVHAAKGAICEQPIFLRFHGSGTEGARGVGFPRSLILLEANARATVVEVFDGSGAYQQNGVTEVRLGAGAHLTHVRIQIEDEAALHFSSCGVSLGKDARYDSIAFALGGSLSRFEMELNHRAAGSVANLHGLYFAGGARKVANNAVIRHRVGHCQTEQLYKGIMAGTASGTFDGKIVVDKDAQRSDARQYNRNLLLSEKASVNSRPQLEIYADDVKCAHGSTTGRLDAGQLFYLRSRGIDAAGAARLLTGAFAGEIIDKVPIERLREQLRDLLDERLRGAWEAEQ